MVNLLNKKYEWMNSFGVGMKPYGFGMKKRRNGERKRKKDKWSTENRRPEKIKMKDEIRVRIRETGAAAYHGRGD